MRYFKHTVAPEILQVCFILRDRGLGSASMTVSPLMRRRKSPFGHKASTLPWLCSEETPAEAGEPPLSIFTLHLKIIVAFFPIFNSGYCLNAPQGRSLRDRPSVRAGWPAFREHRACCQFLQTPTGWIVRGAVLYSGSASPGRVRKFPPPVLSA